jgi:hypothetical protein
MTYIMLIVKVKLNYKIIYLGKDWQKWSVLRGI